MAHRPRVTRVGGAEGAPLVMGLASQDENRDPGEQQHPDVAVQEGRDDGVANVVVPTVGVKACSDAE